MSKTGAPGVRQQGYPNSSGQTEDDSTEDELSNIANDTAFTKILQVRTRKAHRLTDIIVNAKLGIAISDDRVWAEGLLIFYEIFRFLEAALNRLRSKIDVFARFAKVLEGIERTGAFESDLKTYYGNTYLDHYEIRPSVANYLRHLQLLEQREPLRLLVYIYHLYLGLLSGGQILKRKRELRRKVVTIGGLIGNTIPETPQKDCVTHFDDGRSIADIKKEIKFTLDDIAGDLSSDEKNSLLEEGVLVFRNNLEIIQSIKGTGRIAVLNVIKHPIFIVGMLLLVVAVSSFFNY